ncbi:MAG: nuclear transport factor 2 family protein [Alphaproteobacteria bacterium]
MSKPVSKMEQPVDVVREAYACFERHDIPALLRLVDEKCDWQAPGPPEAMAWAGSYHGPDDVRTFFDKLDKSVEILEFTTDKFIQEDDTVVVMGHERDRMRRTGKVVDLDWAHCFEVKKGKITRFHDYQNTAAIQAACC